MENIIDGDNIKLKSMKISKDNKDKKSDLFVFGKTKTREIIKFKLKIIVLFLIIFILMKPYGFKFPKKIKFIIFVVMLLWEGMKINMSDL